MGKCSNAFFSETANMIKAKLYMNVHWTVLYNLKVFSHIEYPTGTKNIPAKFGSNRPSGFGEEA
jgi:hypothetical protein